MQSHMYLIMLILFYLYVTQIRISSFQWNKNNSVNPLVALVGQNGPDIDMVAYRHQIG